MAWTSSIIINVVLIAAVVFGIMIHRRWVWITAGALFVGLFAAFVLLGGLGGAGGAGYMLR